MVEVEEEKIVYEKWCDFFASADLPMCERSKDIILGLLNWIIGLEDDTKVFRSKEKRL